MKIDNIYLAGQVTMKITFGKYRIYLLYFMLKTC